MVLFKEKSGKLGRSRRAMPVKMLAVIILFAFMLPAATVSACEIAKILFGDVTLEVVPHKGYESALIRQGNFQNPHLNFGAIKGEITVDRGGFSVRDNNRVVVGIISPDLRIEGWDDDCDQSQKLVIRKVQPQVYVILNGNTPVGTIKGRFPKNKFGVQ